MYVTICADPSEFWVVGEVELKRGEGGFNVSPSQLWPCKIDGIIKDFPGVQIRGGYVIRGVNWRIELNNLKCSMKGVWDISGSVEC